MIQNALPKSGNCDGDVPRVDMPYVFMEVESAITEISELRLKQVAAPKRGRFDADAVYCRLRHARSTDLHRSSACIYPECGDLNGPCTLASCTTHKFQMPEAILLAPRDSTTAIVKM